jgi:hypothetical protein
MPEEPKNLAAVELGKLGGQKTAERGAEYYAAIQAKRQVRSGGRPRNPPKAAYEGVLQIGDMEIPCAVLDDGTRLLSERGVTKSLGGKRGGSHWLRKQAGAELPVFLSANNLRPFIDNDLESALKTPILYVPSASGSIAHGVPAESLPKICDVWLKARAAGALRSKQDHIAAKAEILVRGFAHVGIIALVDEATGFQYVRARKALEEILEAFVAKEFRKWAKRFPDDFYREICRLRHWKFDEATMRRTPLIGKLTNDLVYERLAPGVRQRLEKLNPKNEKGRRARKHFQWLTADIGDPALREHLASVVTLLKSVDEWTVFMKMMNRALPRYKPMPLFDAAEDAAELALGSKT